MDRTVIPGPTEGRSPESMNTSFSKDFRSLCSWIPGSWATPTPRNDKVYFKSRHYLSATSVAPAIVPAFRVKPGSAAQSSGARFRAALYVLQQRDQRRRGHTGDARRRPQRRRPRRREFAADFGRQAADCGVIEVRGQQQRFVAAEGGDVAGLPFEIPRIARVDFELL